MSTLSLEFGLESARYAFNLNIARAATTMFALFLWKVKVLAGGVDSDRQTCDGYAEGAA